MRQARRQVRPINRRSLARKRFKRVTDNQKRVQLPISHPLVVLGDLKNGSLDSLEQYIDQNQSIPDREVALELRKLISGSAARTAYRIMVVDHPDKPKRKGGRPATRGRRPRQKKFDVAEELAILKKTYPTEPAVAEIAAKHEIVPSTVYRYAKEVADFEAAEARAQARKDGLERDAAAGEQRRKLALRALRARNR